MLSHRHAKTSGLVLAAVLAAFLSAWLATRYTLQAQDPDPAAQLYVSNIIGGWVRATGTAKIGNARVDIVDGNGNPVNGALVIGDWSGCFRENGDSGTTETVCTTAGDGTTTCVDGRAFIEGKKHSCVKSNQNCLFTFTITAVQKDGMTYVPVEGKTSGSLWCNPLAL